MAGGHGLRGSGCTGRRLSEVAQVAGEHAPADIPLPAHEPVRAAARPPRVAAQTVHAPRNSRPPALAPPPAALPFAGSLSDGQGPGTRDDDRGHAQARCGLRHPFGVPPTVPRHPPRRAPAHHPLIVDLPPALATTPGPRAAPMP